MLTLSACGSSGETIAMVPAPTDSAVNTITVNSNEKVNVVPDIAEVVYSVQTESPDAAGCQQQNTEDVNKVVELLTGLGVEEGSIQTTGYYMNPRYSWSNDTQTLIGYEATTTLTVSDLLIDSLGDILTQSVNAGVNNIQSISYLSSNYDESYQEALRLSIEAAKTKAEAMAQAAGCQLGGITQLREQSSYSPARYTDNALAEKTSLSAARDTGSERYGQRNDYARRAGGRSRNHRGISITSQFLNRRLNDYENCDHRRAGGPHGRPSC